MSIRQRLFAGKPLRELRARRGLRQTDMAQRLGISASYLSQLENDERPLTPALADGLRAAFPLDWADLAPAQADTLTAALHEALADPHLPGDLPGEAVERLARQFPGFAEAFVALHGRHSQTRLRLDMLDETIGTSIAAGGACRGRKCATGSTTPTTMSTRSTAPPKRWPPRSRARTCRRACSRCRAGCVARA